MFFRQNLHNIITRWRVVPSSPIWFHIIHKIIIFSFTSGQEKIKKCNVFEIFWQFYNEQWGYNKRFGNNWTTQYRFAFVCVPDKCSHLTQFSCKQRMCNKVDFAMVQWRDGDGTITQRLLDAVEHRYIVIEPSPIFHYH